MGKPKIDIMYRFKKANINTDGYILVWDRVNEVAYTGGWGFNHQYENSIDIWGSEGHVQIEYSHHLKTLKSVI